MPKPNAPIVKGVHHSVAHGFDVYDVSDPHALIQMIGWMKFVSEGQVLYRGQANLYSTVSPSGLRGKSRVGCERMQWRLREYIDGLFGSPCSCHDEALPWRRQHECLERVSRSGRNHYLVSGTWRAAVEPLLQHYGIQTRWLDVVDNVWVALWFACHRQVTEGAHAFHLKRSVAQEGVDATTHIVVMQTGAANATHIPGSIIGCYARLVDLRYAVPSVYLRPHAQHGLLIAPLSATEADAATQLSAAVVGVVRVRLYDALDWLGGGGMVSAHVLFPPAARDEGYRRLLAAPPDGSGALGDITQYGPSY